MASESKKQKVYSPDITPYSFEGRSYFFGTLLSIIVAPIRLISRVIHNVFILPANLQSAYADSLILVSCVFLAIGILDLVLVHRWPLALSQVLALLYGIRLKKQASVSTRIAQEKHTVEINREEVGNTCEEIYDELEEIIGDK